MPLHDDYLNDMLAKKRGETVERPPSMPVYARPEPNNTPYWIIGGTIIVALILIRLLFFGGSDPPTGPTSRTISEPEQKYTLTPDGGKSFPVLIGKTKTTVTIWNQHCIALGRNGTKIKLVGTDGPFNESHEAYYVSKGEPVVVNIIYYPFAHKQCDHLR